MGLESLKQIKNKIDYSRFKKPSFLAVITACGPLYNTKDISKYKNKIRKIRKKWYKL